MRAVCVQRAPVPNPWRVRRRAGARARGLRIQNTFVKNDAISMADNESGIEKESLDNKDDVPAFFIDSTIVLRLAS